MRGERVCPRRAEGSASHVAQFLPLCSASHLAEARRLSALWQGASLAKTRAFSRPSRAHGHHLRPSTNCYKLSEPFYVTQARDLIVQALLSHWRSPACVTQFLDFSFPFLPGSSSLTRQRIGLGVLARALPWLLDIFPVLVILRRSYWIPGS